MIHIDEDYLSVQGDLQRVEAEITILLRFYRNKLKELMSDEVAIARYLDILEIAGMEESEVLEKCK